MEKNGEEWSLTGGVRAVVEHQNPHLSTPFHAPWNSKTHRYTEKEPAKGANPPHWNVVETGDNTRSRQKARDYLPPNRTDGCPGSCLIGTTVPETTADLVTAVIPVRTARYLARTRWTYPQTSPLLLLRSQLPKMTLRNPFAAIVASQHERGVIQRHITGMAAIGHPSFPYLVMRVSSICSGVRCDTLRGTGRR